MTKTPSFARVSPRVPAVLVAACAALGACLPDQRVSGVRQTANAAAAAAAKPDTATPDDFFASPRPLAFTLTLDIAALLRTKAWEKGAQMAFADGRSFALEAKVRGNNNLVDCDFPKLSLRLPDGAPANGTPFAANAKVKIHTHCGDGGAAIHRLKDPKAVLRQAAIHDVLHAAGVPTARVRRALVTYALPKETPFERPAYLLEDAVDAAVRMGGKALSDKDVAALGGDVAGFDPAGVLEQALAQALVGNSDWSFPALAGDADGQDGVRNFEIVDRGAGASPRYVPWAHDFDLGTWVTSRTLQKTQTTDEGVEGETDLLALQANTLLLDARDMTLGAVLFDKHLAAASARFLSKEAEVRAALDAAPFAEGDDEGRALAKAHLEGFYKMLKARAGN